MFYDIVFPESISMKSSYMIEYNTIINKSKNGSELRISNYDYPLLSYNVINDIKTKKELEEIINFFKLVKGRACGFKFKDWLDYKAVNQNIAVADGEQKSFQLIKTYNINNQLQIRKITKPKQVNVFINNQSVVENININYNNGIITFDTPPEKDSIITASFEFYVPVRFDNDKIEIIMKNEKVGEIKDLKIIELLSF